MSQKKVLVLGGTGAMGQHLVPILAEMGYSVDVIYDRFEEMKTEAPNVRYIKADAKDYQFIDDILKNNYDGIVDFLIYPSNELVYKLPKMLDNTGHYIFFSSYRIYANEEHPIRETSPRLWDVSPDWLLRLSDDYCIYKAKGEDLLHKSKKQNYTIVRPSITYSKLRYQLVTLEAHDTVGRAMTGRKAILPEQAKHVQGTMSWGGDAAKMFSRLLFNERALTETFTISTSEHHAWCEIADYYKDICGLQVEWVDKEDYLKVFSPFRYNMHPRWQLDYDRLFDRIIDNSKVLDVTGMKQSDLMPLYDGLKYEISRCPKDFEWHPNPRMDKVMEDLGIN